VTQFLQRVAQHRPSDSVIFYGEDFHDATVGRLFRCRNRQNLSLFPSDPVRGALARRRPQPRNIPRRLLPCHFPANQRALELTPLIPPPATPPLRNACTELRG